MVEEVVAAEIDCLSCVLACVGSGVRLSILKKAYNVWVGAGNVLFDHQEH